jgi:predicted amidohydrolase
VLQANLSQVFMACASAAGTWGGLEFLGSSLIIDPMGRRLAGPLAGDSAATTWADIDLDDVAAARHRGSGIDPRDDRRTDVYSVSYLGVPF